MSGAAGDKPNQDRGPGGARLGELPTSSVLAEATVDSLGEVMSRDPEGYSVQDRQRIVEELRAQRARLAQVEAAGGRVTQPRVAGVGKAKLGTVSADKSAEDLDL